VRDLRAVCALTAVRRAIWDHANVTPRQRILTRLSARVAPALDSLFGWFAHQFHRLLCEEGYIVMMGRAEDSGAITFVSTVMASSGLAAIEKAEKDNPGAFAFDVVKLSDFERAGGVKPSADHVGQEKSRRQDDCRTTALF
jgi:hypothetical protein